MWSPISQKMPEAEVYWPAADNHRDGAEAYWSALPDNHRDGEDGFPHDAYLPAVADNHRDGEDSFPHDFKKYMDAELLYRQLKDTRHFSWIFWNSVVPKNPLTFPDLPRISDLASPNLEERIKQALEGIMDCFTSEPLPEGKMDRSDPFLVQYWAHITNEDRPFLSTCNQPFGLHKIDEGLCRYRMISRKRKFYLDGEDLGVPGRVFCNKLPEFTPNVEYYSSKDYPQRDHALSCHVKQSLALPVFDPSGSGHSCIGVLEFVRTQACVAEKLWWQPIARALKKANLKFEDECGHSCSQNPDKEGFTAAKDEIYKLLEAVCKSNELRLAQTWIPCRLCGDERVFRIPSLSYCNIKDTVVDKDAYLFQASSEIIQLRKGKGVVGRALMSHNPLFCTDVTQFSLVEYPFAHVARECGFSGCFAICLQSLHTGNDLYVLEFFNNQASGDLRLILRTMKQFFQTFRLASGEDLSEELPVHNVMQLYQQPMDLNNGRDVASAEQCNFAVTDSGAKGRRKTSARPQRSQISLKAIQQCEGMTLDAAAKSLNVCRSTLKRACRDNGIKKWSKRRLPILPNLQQDSATVESVHPASVPAAVIPPRSEASIRGATKTCHELLNDTAQQLEDSFTSSWSRNLSCRGMKDKLHETQLSFERAMQAAPLANSPYNGHNSRQNVATSKESENPSLSARCICVAGNTAKSSLKNTICSDSSSHSDRSSHSDTRKEVNRIIKAKYGEDIMKLKFSSTPGITELKNKVVEKQPQIGTFKLKYRDDDHQWILMTSDEDVEDYLHHKRSSTDCLRIVV